MVEVTLAQVLSAREARVATQQKLLERYHNPLICFTMNIPGPVKNSPAIQRAFFYGCEALSSIFSTAILYTEHSVEDTGCQAFYAVDLPPLEAKRRCVELEDAAPLGRLFDLDVLTGEGEKLERSCLGNPQRSCMVCGAPGRGCASRRTHSVAELQTATEQLLRDHFAPLDAERTAALAVQSLLDEVDTTPKPGLVDRNNTGSHWDMDHSTFCASALALRSYFSTCVTLGQETAALEPEKTFARLRQAGLQAEAAMYTATGGVNTHKGIIYSMGILCGALGRLWTAGNPIPETEILLQSAADLSAAAVSADFSRIRRSGVCSTAGETLYRLQGLTGIRGQVAQGFPAVAEIGLPRYRAALAAGFSPNDAGAAALVHLIAAVEDTNLHRRGGAEGSRFAAGAAKAVLAHAPLPTADQIQMLDEAFIARNLSPGGCADLLAITYFLDSLSRETFPWC